MQKIQSSTKKENYYWLKAQKKDMQQFRKPHMKQFQLRQPPWKTGSALQSHPLLRDTRRLRFQSGSKCRISDYGASLRRDGRTGNLNSARQLHRSPGQFLFPFPGDECCRLVPATLRVGAATGPKSTCPSSTTVETRTLNCEEVSSDDGLTVPKEYHWSLASFTIRLGSSAFSKHVFKSVKIWPGKSLSTLDHGHTQKCFWCYQKWQQLRTISQTQFLKKRCAGWRAGLSQNPEHRGRYHSLLLPWWQTDLCFL